MAQGGCALGAEGLLEAHVVETSERAGVALPIWTVWASTLRTAVAGCTLATVVHNP